MRHVLFRGVRGGCLAAVKRTRPVRAPGRRGCSHSHRGRIQYMTVLVNGLAEYQRIERGSCACHVSCKRIHFCLKLPRLHATPDGGSIGTFQYLL